MAFQLDKNTTIEGSLKVGASADVTYRRKKRQRSDQRARYAVSREREISGAFSSTTRMIGRDDSGEGWLLATLRRVGRGKNLRRLPPVHTIGSSSRTCYFPFMSERLYSKSCPDVERLPTPGASLQYCNFSFRKKAPCGCAVYLQIVGSSALRLYEKMPEQIFVRRSHFPIFICSRAPVIGTPLRASLDSCESIANQSSPEYALPSLTSFPLINRSFREAGIICVIAALPASRGEEPMSAGTKPSLAPL